MRDLMKLKKSFEPRVYAPVQFQEVCNLSQMIHAPKSFCIAIGISALKPRETKCPNLKRVVCVGKQESLYVWLVCLESILALNLQ